MTDTEIVDRIAKLIKKHDDNADGDVQLASNVRWLVQRRKGKGRDLSKHAGSCGIWKHLECDCARSRR